MKKTLTILFAAACTAHLASGQTLWGWGANQYEQVGNGTTFILIPKGKFGSMEHRATARTYFVALF